VFIEAKDDGGGGDNWTTGAISRAKLQSNHHHQQTNIQIFTGRMSFLSPNQQCQSTEGKHITFHGLAYPKLTWGSSNFVSNHYLGEGCHASHQPSSASTLPYHNTNHNHQCQYSAVSVSVSYEYLM